MGSNLHKASVDPQGVIHIPAASPAHAPSIHTQETKEEPRTMSEGVWHKTVASKKRTDFPWETTEEDAPVQQIPKKVPSLQPAWTVVEESLNAVRKQVGVVTHRALEEGAQQYTSSFHESTVVGKSVLQSCKEGAYNTWKFLTQPVWIPGRNLKPVQHSRAVLFMLDTVRFGGTFASIFVLLFVGLNYQSFWSIAQSYIEPLAEVTGVSIDAAIDKQMSEKLKRIPVLATAGEPGGDMLAILPPVGPPDDRLIIPSLNLNVPIQVPSNESLLREDWEALEEEIQEGLQNGVVHYPGTARPGQAGNFFVTGHSSYFPWAPGEFKSVFARLHNLSVGDEYWVYYNGDRHRYVIQEKKEIKPSDVTVLDQPVNKRISTLMTCTPVGTTLRRLIIVAQEVDPITGLALKVGERESTQELPRVHTNLLPI